MTTPQLLTFIREQLAIGFSPDAIRKSLVLNGWTDQDLVEAFATVTTSPIPVKKIVPERLPSGKLPLAGMVVLSSIMFMVWQSVGSGQSAALAASTTAAASATPASHTTAPVLALNNPPKPPQKSTGLYTDGAYTGSAADAYYGTIQVQAIIQGGKLTDVKFLQYPSDRSTSVAVNTMAMPILKKEAIAAQSATVDGASGATFTSQAFRESLGAALTLAKS